MKLTDLISSYPELGPDIERLDQARERALGTRSRDCRRPESAVAADLMETAGTLERMRFVAGICGLPASGKTTLAKQTIERLNESSEGQLAAGVPMDGFHFRNSELEELKLFEKKGAINTFHAGQYADFLHRAKRSYGSPLAAPEYDRPIHEVVENAIPIEPCAKILVSEGIYVGLDFGEWMRSRREIDKVYYLDRPIELCLQRIIDRNLAVGRGEEIIVGKLKNDLFNCIDTVRVIGTADEILY